MAIAVKYDSVLDDLREDDGTTPSALRAAARGPLSAWFKGGISGKKIAVLGDSTSDGTGNASSLYSPFLSFYQAGGEVLNGTTILDYGSNGASLAAWLGGGGASGKMLSDLIAAAPELIVFSFGINDVRQGATNQAQMTALLIQAIDLLREALPGTDFVLRMPNSLCNDAGTLATYLSPATALMAQTCTDILRNSYRSLVDAWPNVFLWDTQADIFGETVKAIADNPLMSDTLHPSGLGYSDLADGLAAIAGYRAPFSAVQAAAARSANYPLDYTVYPRAVEDTGHYEVRATGRFLNMGSNYIRFQWPAGRAIEVAIGDIIVLGDQLPFVLSGQGYATTYNDGTPQQATQIGLFSGSFPYSISAGTVSVYRHRYGADSTIELYANKFSSFPYKWRGRVDNCGNGWLRVIGFNNELPAGSRSLTATSDTMVVAGLGAVTPFDYISVFSANVLEFGKSGTNFTPYYLNTIWIFGNHAYENGTTTRIVADEPPNTQAN